MATLGHGVVDRVRRIRVRRIDSFFGTHASEIANAVREAAEFASG
ncbi:MAG: hypothetical protein ACRDHK_04530 [Actinomycetota bacterium]